MIFKLFKILASNIFSFGGIFESFKKGPREIVKNIVIGLLLIYAFGSFLVLYAVSMNTTYKYLAAIGETSLMPLLAMLLAVFFILFFGFTSVASNYYTGTGDEQLLSMPITPVQFFSAKFAVSFVTDAVLGIVIFAIAAGIYAFHEGLLTNPLFYIGTLVTGICFTSIAIALVYLLLIIILLFVPRFRKKSILNGIASVCIIAFAAIYSFLNSRISIIGSMGDMEDIGRTLEPSVGILRDFSSSYSFPVFLSGAVSGKIIPVLIMLVVFAAVVFGLIPACGNLYIKTLNGFSDVKSKKLSVEKVEQVINKDVHSQSIFSALLWRDVRTVLREPAFFANGPLMVFLFPVILVVSFTIGFASASDSNVIAEMQRDIAKLFDVFTPERKITFCYYIMLIGAAITAFIGNSSNIAVSAFSREGKALYDLKAMPIQNQIIAKVKFVHAFVYIIISDLIVTLIMLAIRIILKVPLLPLECGKIILNMSLLNFTISQVLVYVDLFIDTAHPKLQWENPTAAFKQNLNSLIGVFITIAVAGVVIGAGFILPKNQIGLSILIVIFGVIGAILGANYFKYAEKRISSM